MNTSWTNQNIRGILYLHKFASSFLIAYLSNDKSQMLFIAASLKKLQVPPLKIINVLIPKSFMA